METNNLYIWSIKNIKSNRISIHAAQVAFFIMVSFFPFLMFLQILLYKSLLLHLEIFSCNS